MKRSKPSRVFLGLLFTGLAAGFINGLLGAGGGIIIIFVLSRILPEMADDKNGAFAVALCVMLPISILSCAVYASRGSMSSEGFGIFILPALIGGALGGILLGKINSALLKKLFSALVAVSGIILIVR